MPLPKIVEDVPRRPIEDSSRPSTCFLRVRAPVRAFPEDHDAPSAAHHGGLKFRSSRTGSARGSRIARRTSRRSTGSVRSPTYKWPTCSTGKPKHRILGVRRCSWTCASPLRLDKIIFVDADQVVRADLRELWEMGLVLRTCSRRRPPTTGSPCKDASVLARHWAWRTPRTASLLTSARCTSWTGRRRRRARAGPAATRDLRAAVAGPQLAGQPGPGPAQLRAAPGARVFVLPQPWLPRVWCGNDFLPPRKTIDLCNRLDDPGHRPCAARIVREWPSLDREVRAFTDEVERRIYGEAP